MTSGGARGNAGRAPDYHALRREKSEAWLTLPEKRTGGTPKWPLPTATAREKTLWRAEWRRPQAVMWERHAQEVEVAIYVRTLIAAEKHEASVAVRTLLRQQQEALGLSLPGLARNRWRIGERSAPARATATSASSARDRFKVVSGGQAS